MAFCALSECKIVTDRRPVEWRMFAVRTQTEAFNVYVGVRGIEFSSSVLTLSPRAFMCNQFLPIHPAWNMHVYPTECDVCYRVQRLWEMRDWQKHLREYRNSSRSEKLPVKAEQVEKHKAKVRHWNRSVWICEGVKQSNSSSVSQPVIASGRESWILLWGGNLWTKS